MDPPLTRGDVRSRVITAAALASAAFAITLLAVAIWLRWLLKVKYPGPPDCGSFRLLIRKDAEYGREFKTWAPEIRGERPHHAGNSCDDSVLPGQRYATRPPKNT